METKHTQDKYFDSLERLGIEPKKYVLTLHVGNRRAQSFTLHEPGAVLDEFSMCEFTYFKTDTKLRKLTLEQAKEEVKDYLIFFESKYVHGCMHRIYHTVPDDRVIDTVRDHVMMFKD